MKRAILTPFRIALLAVNYLFANIGPEGFNDFPNEYFVETGTYKGDGLYKALQTGNYAELYSMDINPEFIKQAELRFLSFPNVHAIEGDTGKDLAQLISTLDKPITFWLDAHNSHPDPYGGKNTPLLHELDQIKSHFIKTHTILIDDMHCCKTVLFDFLTQEQIVKKLLEINPNYTIEYVRGGDEGEYPKNVLVARIK